jgi:hypothetical protein
MIVQKLNIAGFVRHGQMHRRAVRQLVHHFEPYIEPFLDRIASRCRCDISMWVRR